MLNIKKWIFPVVMVISAGLGIFWLWPKNIKPPTLQQTEFRPPVPVPANLDRADALRIKNRYGEFRFIRKTDGWHMTAPFAAKASDKLISGLLSKMQAFQFGLVVSQSPETHVRDKVDKKQAVEVEVSAENRSLWHFYLGKSTEYTLFREEGSNNVWQIRGAQRQAFVRDAAAWMRPEIVGKREQDVVQLAFFRPDGSEFVRFSFDGEAREIKTSQLPQGISWHPARVKRSLTRLLSLRLSFVETGPAKTGADSEGTAELVFADGTAMRISIFREQNERVPLHIEERSVPGEAFRPLPYVPLVQSHTLRDLLLLNALDMADPMVFKTDESSVVAMRGKCSGFSWDFIRDQSGSLVVKSSTREFALARSRLDEFFNFLSSGKLEASDVVNPMDVPAEFMPGTDGDFLELDILQEKNKKPQTVRIAWGKPTPVNESGIWFHYATVSGRSDRVYKVMDKNIVAICRDRDSWMLQPKDPENTPVPGH